MKKILFVLILLINTNLIFSQDLEVKWSEQMEYSNNTDGFFSDYIDANNKFIYSLYTISKDDGTIKARKIIAFDKNTMAKISSVAIHGHKENSINKAEYNDLLFKKIIVQNDFIYVFWTKINSQNEELFVDCFDSSLKKIKPLTKIYSMDFPNDMKRGFLAKNASSIVVLENKNKEHRIIIGSEKPRKNQYIEFNYGMLETDLSISNEKKILLPNKLADAYYGAMSEFQYLYNGDLTIRTNVTSDVEKGKKDDVAMGGLIGGLLIYPTFSYIKISTGEISTIELLNDNSIFPNNEMLPVIHNNLVKFYCLYIITSDKNNLVQGLFHTEFNIETMKNTGLNVKEFDKKTICQLYNTTNDEISKKTYWSNLTLDSVISTKKNDIILFCALTGFSSSSSGASYAVKGRISILKINDQNEIIWNKSIDRKKNYSTLTHNDIKLTGDQEQIFMIYGNYNEETAVDKLIRNQYQHKIECIVFDIETGDFEKKILALNSDKETEQKDTYIPTIRVIDNQYFINYTDAKKGVGNVGKISFD